MNFKIVIMLNPTGRACRLHAYCNFVRAVFELLNNTESYLVLLPGRNAMPYNNIRDEGNSCYLIET